jgi:hypothetical protein
MPRYVLHARIKHSLMYYNLDLLCVDAYLGGPASYWEQFDPNID